MPVCTDGKDFKTGALENVVLQGKNISFVCDILYTLFFIRNYLNFEPSKFLKNRLIRQNRYTRFFYKKVKIRLINKNFLKKLVFS